MCTYKNASKWGLKIVQKAFILGAVITFIYLLFNFFSGSYVRERLDGTWKAICIQDELTFMGSTYTRGRESGEFRIRANYIYFCANGYRYPIRITSQYLWLNGIYYVKGD